MLRTKLAHLERWNAARRSAHGWYVACLAGSAAELVHVDDRATAVHHLEVVRVPDRPRVIEALRDAEIGHGIHYPTPCHRHEPFVGHADRPLPIVEVAADQILSLPMFPTLRREEVERVCEVVRHAVDGR